ncbi:MAG: hypothetical protein Q8L85_03880 [Alphaproteobacteria bacterium]|nr:hypothetical protein [Alphaproteobacteria bacterium]
MRQFFYILSFSIILHTPFVLYANDSSDDETSSEFSSDEAFADDPKEMNAQLEFLENDFAVLELADKSALPSKHTESYFFSNVRTITNLLDNISILRENIYNAFFKNYIQNKIKKLHKESNDKNHKIIYTRFINCLNEENNFYNFLSTVDVFPYNIQHELNVIKETLNIVNLPKKTQFVLMKFSTLTNEHLDRIILKLENAKSTKITFNQFLEELENIDVLLSQASSIFGMLLASEKLSLENEDSSTDHFNDESDNSSEENSERQFQLRLIERWKDLVGPTHE